MRATTVPVHLLQAAVHAKADPHARQRPAENEQGGACMVQGMQAEARHSSVLSMLGPRLASSAVSTLESPTLERTLVPPS